MHFTYNGTIDQLANALIEAGVNLSGDRGYQPDPGRISPANPVPTISRRRGKIVSLSWEMQEPQIPIPLPKSIIEMTPEEMAEHEEATKPIIVSQLSFTPGIYNAGAVRVEVEVEDNTEEAWKFLYWLLLQVGVDLESGNQQFAYEAGRSTARDYAEVISLDARAEVAARGLAPQPWDIDNQTAAVFNQELDKLGPFSRFDVEEIGKAWNNTVERIESGEVEESVPPAGAEPEAPTTENSPLTSDLQAKLLYIHYIYWLNYDTKRTVTALCGTIPAPGIHKGYDKGIPTSTFYDWRKAIKKAQPGADFQLWKTIGEVPQSTSEKLRGILGEPPEKLPPEA